LRLKCKYIDDTLMQQSAEIRWLRMLLSLEGFQETAQFQLAQDGTHWLILVNVVKNLQVAYRAKYFLITKYPYNSQLLM
jgi:hypothetical protein